MKFSYVIPSINQTKMLINDCIDSLLKHENLAGDEIIVVDDGSPSHIQSVVKAECERRGVTVILRPANGGFPIAANEGIRAATGDVVVMVNNDVQFIEPVKKKIIASFERDSKIGIVGSLLLYPHGTIQHGGIVAVGNGGFTHRGWHRKPEEVSDFCKGSYLIGVTGALFAMKRPMLNQIGLFNEKYFLSCDDTEYCLRAWANGW